MKTLLPVIVILLFGLYACNNTDKNSSLIFEELNESLERSSKMFRVFSNTSLESLKSKVDEPATSEKAIRWLSLADSIYSKANYLIGYIDSLKTNSNQNQIGKDFSTGLYIKLIAFKEFVLQKNIELKTGYDGSAEILGKGDKNDIEFYQTYFLNKSNQITLAFLSKLKNDIAMVAYNMVSYCNNQITGPHFKFLEHFHVISAASGGVFRKGQEMSIQVGIGEFSTKSNPVYEINGINVEPNDKGVCDYKVKISNKPGNYKAHVKVRYTEDDGREMNIEKDIQYEVIE